MDAAGYRIARTGVFGYEYYADGEKILYAGGLVVPSPAILIRCSGIEWESPFDQESTIVPGLTRTIMDAVSEKEIARIVYRETGRYEIVMAGEVWAVLAEDDGYRFLSGKEEAGCLKRIGGQKWPAQTSEELIPWFSFRSGLENRREICAVWMAFPALRFAI